jgi:hypothetical protein
MWAQNVPAKPKMGSSRNVWTAINDSTMKSATNTI